MPGEVYPVPDIESDDEGAVNHSYAELDSEDGNDEEDDDIVIKQAVVDDVTANLPTEYREVLARATTRTPSPSRPSRPARGRRKPSGSASRKPSSSLAWWRRRTPSWLHHRRCRIGTHHPNPSTLDINRKHHITILNCEQRGKKKMAVISERWTKMRTLGRGASGAEVYLAADDNSGELFAVKSACASGAAALRREQAIMSSLRSQRVVSCIGGRAGRDGSFQLFLEFAPGGSLADEVAKAGRLEERRVRGYAADVAAGLAYLHGESIVHGDIKARNVVLVADGRAKLADFGCARKAGDPIIGGTPAFMAPEVARGEEQGPAADVWALGCIILEMATGRAPWSGMDGDALAAMHKIGYTNSMPEVPQWLSAEAKDFLARCLIREPTERCTAAQLLEHPFLASSVVLDTKQGDVKSKWVSPKSTLEAALWESESDTEEDLSHSSMAERIKALACPASALPDWDSDDGWIDVLSTTTEASDAVLMPAKDMADLDDGITREEQFSEYDVLGTTVDSSDSSVLYVVNGEEAGGDYSVRHQLVCQDLLQCKLVVLLRVCNRNINEIEFVLAQTLCLALLLCFYA
uniref:Uncharacterized protein n=1 Tax=Avena sativa TaxID=4498 RepID=A0ACD5TE48_AVESA